MSDASTAPLPLLMADEELEQAIAVRRREGHEQFRRAERPDPWPIVASRFPRIAAEIRAKWGQPMLDKYFAHLVIDERGSRAGFPPEVLASIMELARLHADRFRYGRTLCPWEHDVAETKWWDRG